MLTALFTALRNHWNTDTILPTLVPSGLFLGTAPEGTAYPLAVLQQREGGEVTRSATGDTLETVLLHFIVGARALVVLDPIADAIEARFDRAMLPGIPALYCDRRRPRFAFPNAPQVWQLSLEYMVMVQRQAPGG